MSSSSCGCSATTRVPVALNDAYTDWPGSRPSRARDSAVISAVIEPIVSRTRLPSSAIGSITAEITAESRELTVLEPSLLVPGLTDATGARVPTVNPRAEDHTSLSASGWNWKGRPPKKFGSIMAEVIVDIGGQAIVAAVTRGGVEQLGVEAGDDVVVLIKATEVMLGK